VYEKLGIISRAELIGYLIVNKLMDISDIGVARKVAGLEKEELLKRARKVNEGIKKLKE
jgi:hypothetical protein